MARSLRVRQACIGTIKLSVKRDGFLNQRALAEDIGLARSTVSNFLTGKPVDRVVFEEVCDRLSLNWQKIAEFKESGTSIKSQVDWGDTPDLAQFCGRSEELATLEQWIVEEQCHLVSILGIGGVGKTALSVRLSEQTRDLFDFVIWRSLLDDNETGLLRTFGDFRLGSLPNP